MRVPSGRRRCRPGSLHADKAYDLRANRQLLRQPGHHPQGSPGAGRSPRRGLVGTGGDPWRAERTIAWAAWLPTAAVATSAATRASARLCCWPARCAATTSSSSHQGDPRLSPTGPSALVGISQEGEHENRSRRCSVISETGSSVGHDTLTPIAAGGAVQDAAAVQGRVRSRRFSAEGRPAVAWTPPGTDAARSR